MLKAKYYSKYRANKQSMRFWRLTGLLLTFPQHDRDYYRFSTEVAKSKVAIRPTKVLYAPLPARDFGVVKFKAVREYRMQVGERSPQYVDKNLNRTRQIVRMAVGDGFTLAEQYTSPQCVAP